MGADRGTLVGHAGASDSGESAVAPVERGACVDRYVVLDWIGAGGMGTVCKAIDPELDRVVALKFLLVAGGTGTAGDGRTRLMREARAMAKLAHPNVITVYDVGEHGDSVFVAMEFVDGMPLSAWRAAAPRSLEAVVDTYLAAGRGLAAAHEVGLVHRDFKPDNVMIGRDGRVRVLDFGLAQSTGMGATRTETLPPADMTSSNARLADLTQAGAVMGTPAYMAPEQFRGADTDARTDLFSFCVALYEELYDTRPFAGDTYAALAESVCAGQISDAPTNAPVPAPLRTVLVRALSPNPTDRPASMMALLANLQPFGSEGGAGRLRGVWDASIKAKVRAAFETSGRGYAADTLERVERALDDYVARWLDACRDVDENGSPDTKHVQLAWLSQRLDELAALSSVLGDADADVVDHSVEACERLTPVRDYANASSLHAYMLLPQDDAVAAQVARVRLSLARASKLHDAGHYRDALPAARLALADARACDYGPVEAEALVLVGELEFKCGDGDGAASTLERGFLASDAAGHDAVRARAALALIGVLGTELARPDDARRWASHAESVVSRLGNDPRLRGRLRRRLGHVADVEGDYDAALVHYGAALEGLEQAFGSEHTEVAAVHMNIGNSLVDAGRLSDGAAHLERALALTESSLGAEHPRITGILAALGYVRTQRGDARGARAVLERAVLVGQRSLGEQHPHVAIALGELADALLLCGEPTAARDHARAALRIREAVYDPDHPYVAIALASLGDAELACGDAASARSHLERAHAALADSGRRDRSAARAAFALARALGHEDSRAQQLATTAQQLYAADASDNHAELASINAWLDGP